MKISHQRFAGSCENCGRESGYRGTGKIWSVLLPFALYCCIYAAALRNLSHSVCTWQKFKTQIFHFVNIGEISLWEDKSLLKIHTAHMLDVINSFTWTLLPDKLFSLSARPPLLNFRIILPYIFVNIAYLDLSLEFIKYKGFLLDLNYRGVHFRTNDQKKKYTHHSESRKYKSSPTPTTEL